MFWTAYWPYLHSKHLAGAGYLDGHKHRRSKDPFKGRVPGIKAWGWRHNHGPSSGFLLLTSPFHLCPRGGFPQV